VAVEQPAAKVGLKADGARAGDLGKRLGIDPVTGVCAPRPDRPPRAPMDMDVLSLIYAGRAADGLAARRYEARSLNLGALALEQPLEQDGLHVAETGREHLARRGDGALAQRTARKPRVGEVVRDLVEL